jgi:hypothetical protein
MNNMAPVRFPVIHSRRLLCGGLLVALVAGLPLPLRGAEAPPLGVGIAVRDITPQPPIWLAGYASRNKPAEKIDHPLLAQAVAFRNATGERFVLAAFDNCEVSPAFNEPVLQAFQDKYGLKPGEVLLAASHTHAAPVLEKALEGMYPLKDADKQRVRQYSQLLRDKLVEVVGAALADVQPATLEHGVGRATFAMNRRVYKEDQMAFGENPDAPVDWDVPVLRIRSADTNRSVRAVLFGYACHGTSIQGDDFYIISGDYMAYARQHLEALLPGTVAVYLQGMGADSNPSPRGTLLDAKRHGLELAGAVMTVLNRPLRPVAGPLRLAYDEVPLPLEAPPSQELMEKDAQGQDVYLRNRAITYLELLKAGKPLPAVRLPVAAIRFGDDLTLLAMGGEVVVDYAIKFKRLFAADHPWTVGYAYEVPCYIPSVRILKEGGYEAQSSLIYYGLYGPFRTRVEDILVKRMMELVGRTRDH